MSAKEAKTRIKINIFDIMIMFIKTEPEVHHEKR